MIDLPLHPISVHFPITLGVLIPLVSVFLFFAIRSGKMPDQVWVIVPLLACLYLGSALMAEEFGEDDEEKVEKIVGESALEEHEEAGEKVPWAAGIVLLASGLPLFFRKNSKLKVASILISGVAIAPLLKAGHTGGELVYKHGAAKAHTMDAEKATHQLMENPEDTEDESD